MTNSLLSYLNYRVVLPALGVTVPTSVLPIMLKCPACASNTLWATPNINLNDVWLYCKQCGRAGDVLEWASFVRKQPHLETLQYLQSANVLPRRLDAGELLAERQQLWGKSREHLQKLFATGRAQLRNPHSETSQLLQRNLELGWASPQWRNHLANYAGIVTPSQLRNPDAKAETPPSVLIMPFCDLPGRYTGVVRLNLDMAAPPLLRMHTGAFLADCTGYSACAGIFNLAPALAAADKIFICYDVITTVMDCLRRIATHNECLPVIVPVKSTDKRIAHILGQAPPAKYIHVGSITEMLHLANEFDCEVVTVDKSPLRKAKDPYVNLHQLRKRATNWQTALMRHLNKLERSQRPIFFSNLELDANAAKKFIRVLPYEMQQQLIGPLDTGVSRTFKWNDREITESADGWKLATRNVQLTNAVIRIDRVIRDTARQRFPIYEGRILLKGKVYPFCFEKSTKSITSTLFQRIAIFLAENYGCVDFKYADSRQLESRAAYSLVITAAAPEYVTLNSKIGWDPEARDFNLWNFRIDTGGRITPQIRHKRATKYERPGMNNPTESLLSPEQPLTKEQLEALQYDMLRSCCTFWQLTAGILHNVLAPYFGHQSKHIAIMGYFDKKYRGTTAVELAEAMGCSYVQRACGLHWAGKRIDAASVHSWPLLFGVAHSGTYSKLRAHHNFNNMITWSTPYAGVMNKGILVAQSYIFDHSKWIEVAPLVLPRILQYAMANQLRPTMKEDTLATVYRIIRGWMETIGARTDGVIKAEKVQRYMMTNRMFALVAFVCEGDRMQNLLRKNMSCPANNHIAISYKASGNHRCDGDKLNIIYSRKRVMLQLPKLAEYGTALKNYIPWAYPIPVAADNPKDNRSRLGSVPRQLWTRAWRLYNKFFTPGRISKISK